MAKDVKLPAGAGEAKRGFTTFRIYEEHGENLSDLAALLGKTAADVYEQFCAGVIRDVLRKEMEAKLKKLK